MGDFTNQDFYWSNQQAPPQQPNFYEHDFSQFAGQQLEFKAQDYGDQQGFAQYPELYNPNNYEAATANVDEEFDEPPLLEELEIYPDRIAEKVLAVLNPLRGHSLADDSEYLTRDADLAGPVFFCMVLAAALLLAGKSASFGYIYAFSVVSTVLMYCLLSLMASVENVFTIGTVGSILGYCLIPVVALAVAGVFVSLQAPVGVALAAVAVLWASYSASRLFVAVSGDRQQRPLVMYPSALVYVVFVLLVVF